jgi:predicted glycosyltransferase involved in capsule biosynthesis
MSKDITFITHLRYDHEDRLKNLQTILNYYSNNLPDARFILVEDDSEHNKEFDKVLWPKKRTSFYFIKNNSYYYRTRALNYGIKKAKTSIVISLDTDCIVPMSSFSKCIDMLYKDTTIAWPYNGYFIDVSNRLHEEFIKDNYNYDSIFKQMPNVNTMQLGCVYEDFSVRCTNTVYEGVGGIVMFNRERFLDIGSYNEKFICWGAEDNELFTRCNILEHKKYRDTDINSICFHLHHKNAIRAHHPYYQQNFDEANLVGKMSKLELQDYIKTWKHLDDG